MRVALTIIEQIARARTDLRMGVPVILSAGPAQTLVVPIETLSQARLDQMIASKHHLYGADQTARRNAENCCL